MGYQTNEAQQSQTTPQLPTTNVIKINGQPIIQLQQQPLPAIKLQYEEYIEGLKNRLQDMTEQLTEELPDQHPECINLQQRITFLQTNITLLANRIDELEHRIQCQLP